MFRSLVLFLVGPGLALSSLAFGVQGQHAELATNGNALGEKNYRKEIALEDGTEVLEVQLAMLSSDVGRVSPSDFVVHYDKAHHRIYLQRAISEDGRAWKVINELEAISDACREQVRGSLNLCAASTEGTLSWISSSALVYVPKDFSGSVELVSSNRIDSVTPLEAKPMRFEFLDSDSRYHVRIKADEQARGVLVRMDLETGGGGSYYHGPDFLPSDFESYYHSDKETVSLQRIYPELVMKDLVKRKKLSEVCRGEISKAFPHRSPPPPGVPVTADIQLTPGTAFISFDRNIPRQFILEGVGEIRSLAELRPVKASANSYTASHPRD